MNSVGLMQVRGEAGAGAVGRRLVALHPPHPVRRLGQCPPRADDCHRTARARLPILVLWQAGQSDRGAGASSGLAESKQEAGISCFTQISETVSLTSALAFWAGGRAGAGRRRADLAAAGSHRRLPGARRAPDPWGVAALASVLLFT